jgi:hypothetical protein
MHMLCSLWYGFPVASLCPIYALIIKYVNKNKKKMWEQKLQNPGTKVTKISKL